MCSAMSIMETWESSGFCSKNPANDYLSSQQSESLPRPEIRVENLGKLYQIGPRERYKALRDTLTDAISAGVMKRIETDRRLEGGVDFAEVGKLTDSPLKHHFNGMAMRRASCSTDSWQLPSGPDAHHGFCCDDELTSRAIRILLQNGFHQTHSITWIVVARPKQYHTMVCLTPAKDEFAEIFVIRNQDSSLTGGPGHNILIVGLRHHLSNGYHVMAVAAQVFDHRGTGRLIDDEVHDGWDLGRHGEGKDILLGEHLGSVG
jgi:hypothetical protein